MSEADEYAPPNTNRLLQALTPTDRDRVIARCQLVQMETREVLYEPNRPILAAYFPLTCILSVISTLEDGAAIEVATVGNEGMLGLPIFLGANATPTNSFCQIPGLALRLSAEELREELRESRALASVLQIYTQAMFNQIAQTAACNRHHQTKQRCARWLLMTHDRVQTDQYPLTQEFLGQMLGVRRASVNEVAQTLQEEGLITYRRGIVTIQDRRGLEGTACACYSIIRDEFDRLFGGD